MSSPSFPSIWDERFGTQSPPLSGKLRPGAVTVRAHPGTAQPAQGSFPIAVETCKESE